MYLTGILQVGDSNYKEFTFVITTVITKKKRKYIIAYISKMFEVEEFKIDFGFKYRGVRSESSLFIY